MHKLFGISFTDGGVKTEQTKEPEAAPAAETEKEEQLEDKKVLPNHVPVVIKKPRSQSMIPVYVRVNVQSYNFRQQMASLGFFVLFSLLLLLLPIMMSFNTSGRCASSTGWVRRVRWL